MGAGDYAPPARYRKKADPKRAKKIKEGGKRADQIRLQREAHHHAEEVPIAEEELLKALKSIN